MGYRFDKASNRVIPTKPAVRSLTYWGIAVATIPALINSAIEHSEDISEAIGVAVGSGVLTPQAVATLTLVGGIMAVIGRAKAKKEIKGVVSDE
jgi:hypothetical protein